MQTKITRWLAGIWLVLGGSAALAQGVPIGALPNATLPLSGSEYTILSQNGITVKATVLSTIAPGLTLPANTLMGNNTGASATATGLTVAQVQTMLGLGTAAFRNIGSSGANVPLLSTANTWSSLQTFSGGVSIGGLVTLTNLDVTGTTHLGTGTASYMTITSTGISANIASASGTIELLPSNGTVNVTGALNTSTGVTVGNGLTVTLGGAAITGGLQVSNLGATITGTSSITGNTSILSGTFTASGGAFAASPSNANVVLSPTGTGVVTINPGSAGTMNNMVIGGATPLGGAFTTLSASSTVSGLGFSAYLASPPAIGSVSPSTGKFTTLQATTSLTLGASSALTGASGTGVTLGTTSGALTNTHVATFNATGDIVDGGALPTTFLTWQGIKTVAFAAAANSQYCVDTLTTGAVTMTLSATPTDGDKVQFIDCKSNFAIANLTVARNGKTIMGIAADMTVNTTNGTATLIYVSANNDWRMY